MSAGDRLLQVLGAAVEIVAAPEVAQAASRCRAAVETAWGPVALVVQRGDRELTRSAPDLAAPVVEVGAAHEDVRVSVQLRATSIGEAERCALSRLVALLAVHVAALARAEDAAVAAHAHRKEVDAVSHDLRTPLQSLTLGVDAVALIVAGSTVETALEDRIERMRRSVRTMASLVDRLLALGR